MTQSNGGSQELWDLAAVAARVGVTYNSARTYHGRAEINRRLGDPKTGDMPPPDGRFGRSPVWAPETIDKWVKRRRPYVRKAREESAGAGSDVEATLGVGDS